METFLDLNAHVIDAPDAAVVSTILETASGVMPEEQLAKWIRVRYPIKSGSPDPDYGRTPFNRTLHPQKLSSPPPPHESNSR